MPYYADPLIRDEGTDQGSAAIVDFVGAGVTAAVSGGVATVTIAGGAGNPTLNAFTQDLGVSRSSGTFDLTGLSGLAADKPVLVMQTAAAISSKGDARDEPEMDQIQVTGYVVDATTIRCYWQAPAVVVGTYAFAYFVGA